MSVSDGIERRAELLFEGTGAPGNVKLGPGSIYLGSGADAAIRLEDDVLEERHLELDWDGKELWLIHLGKGMRPTVNGALVAEAQLQSGDRVEIGGNVFTVRILRRRSPLAATAPAAQSPATVAADQTSAAAEPTPAPAPPKSPNEQVLLEFSVHLLRQQPRKGAAVIAGLLLFFVLMGLYIVPGSPFLLAVAGLVLVGSVGAFLFPLRYRLTEAGVEIRGFPVRDRKRWDRFTRYVEFSDAVQLLVSQKDIRGRIVKGSLVYYGDRKDEIMAIVRSKVPKGGPPVPRAPKAKRKVAAK